MQDGLLLNRLKNTQNLIFYRREIQTALPFALRVSTSPCRCHFERSAQHGVEILRKQNREAKSRQGNAFDDRGGSFQKRFLKIDFPENYCTATAFTF